MYKCAVAAFPSIQGAVNAAPKLAQQEISVSVLEMLNETFMHSINEQGSADGDVERDANNLQVLWFDSRGRSRTNRAVQKLSKEAGSLSLDVGQTQTQEEEPVKCSQGLLVEFLITREHSDDQFVNSDA
jgi:hypothetical protein